MAIIIELVNSRDITVSDENPSVELIYVVHGTEDEQAARLLVEQTLPAFYVITRLVGFITTVFQSYQVQHQGGGIWNVSAKYGRRTPARAGQVILNFDTGGGTTHITQSISTESSYMRDPVTNAIVDAPLLRGAINVDKDKVSGVDIGLKSYKWSETWHLPRSLLTSNYRKKLKAATKTWNDADFREFKLGEVLFEGVSGIKDTNEDFSELTFHFSQSDNAEDLSIGDGAIVGIVKQGWDYLWVRYRKETDPMNKVVLQIPDHVYVERVYEFSSFADLGIGVLPLD